MAIIYQCAGRRRGYCDYESDVRWLGRCPSCGRYYDRVQRGDDAFDQRGEYSTLGGSGKKYQHQYLSTGQDGFDKVLGGGLVAGRVVLLGGFEGTGKTRLLIMACDYIAKTQGKVIYASGEESDDEVNSIAASLGIVNDHVIVLGNQRSVEKVLELATKVKAFLVVYDSAQKFASDYAGGNTGSGSQLKAIGEAIKDHCGKTKSCAIVVNQMSNDGELKGGTELRHHCDTVMVLAYPKEDDPDAPREDDIRVLDGGKNRVGPENIKTYWRMSSEGRLEHIPPRSRLISEPRRSKHSKN